MKEKLRGAAVKLGFVWSCGLDGGIKTEEYDI